MSPAATLAGNRGPTERFRARRLTNGVALSRASGSSAAGPGGGTPANGLVAQLVEHPLCKRGASGSNPDESTLPQGRGLDLAKGPLNNHPSPSPRDVDGNTEAPRPRRRGPTGRPIWPARTPMTVVHASLHGRAYAAWTKRVATSQMGDRSAREPRKVVPSRDITLGRRKEPLNQRLPNGTSWPQGHSLREREPAELKHLSRQRKRNQSRFRE